MAVKQITINPTNVDSLQVKAFVKDGLAIVPQRGMENYIYHEQSGLRISWYFLLIQLMLGIAYRSCYKLESIGRV